MTDISYDRITKDIQINGQGDLVLTSDTSKSDGIKQDCVARLSTFAGEYFLDSSNNVGVQWVRDVFQVSPVSYSKADELIRSNLLLVNGVSEIVSVNFDLSKSSRQLSITFVALTDDGAKIQGNIEV